jgi:hypothetical protein
VFNAGLMTLGSTVTGIIDGQTRPNDVYAIDLTAGQNISVVYTSNVGGGGDLVYPDAQSIKSYDSALKFTYDGGAKKITIATSGRYYLILDTTRTGVTYTLTVTETG